MLDLVQPVRFAKMARLSETVGKLLTRGARTNALHILSQLHPWEVAELVGRMPAHRASILKLLMDDHPRLAGEVLSELGPRRAAELLAVLSSVQISRIVQELDGDDAVELLGELPAEIRDEILAAMRETSAAGIEDLLHYPERSAGRIMNPNAFSLLESSTVAETMAILRESLALNPIIYLYVVDDRKHLVGVLSLRGLLQSPSDARLKDIMLTDVIRVSTATDQEVVARIVASYNLLAVPVVDGCNQLVGVINVDDVIDVIQEEATEDIYRMAGLSVQERVFSSARTTVRLRSPWLAVNLVTAFLAAFAVNLFQGAIQRFAVLAVFMPVVAGMGGNAAAQTMTVMVRGIALGELRWSNVPRVIFKEIAAGGANGIALGIVVALLALLWKGHVVLGVVLALAMLGNLLVAATSGTLVPLILMWLKVDPAIASSVIVTTFTDVLGFLMFLGLGDFLLNRFG